MSKVLATVAEVIAGVALIATGVGAIALPGFVGVVSVAGVSTTAMFAASAALTVAADLLQKKPQASVSPFSWKADPQAGIPYAMGECYQAGEIRYRMAYGDDNKYQTLVTVLSGGGPHEGPFSLYVDNTIRFIGGDSVVSIPDYGYMWAKTQLGAQPEAARLIVPPIAPYGWTTACKLSGYAASIVTLKYDTKGDHTLTTTPAVGWYGKWARVYDPRKDGTYIGGYGSHRWNDESTWEYSENPYLHALTWLIGRRHNGKLALGVGVDLNGSSVLVQQFVEGANVADANGWTCSGVVSSTDNKWEVLKKILRAGAGQPMKLGAQIGVLVNTPKVSVATVTPADLAGKVGVQSTQGRKDRLNSIVPRYMGRQDVVEQNSDNQNITLTTWDMMAAAPVKVDAYITADGKTRQRQVDYDLVRNINQAAQLARYDIENAREFGPVTLKLKLRWMGYRPGDVITANLPEDGLNGQPLLILQRTLDPKDGTVTLVCRSETNAKHAFALGQTGTAPDTPGVTSLRPLVPTPTAAEWDITGTSVSSGGIVKPAIVVTGASASDTIDGIVFESRIYTGTQGDDDGWHDEGIASPTTVTKAITGLPGGTQYQVSIRYRRGTGVSSTRLILGPATTDTASGDNGASGIVVPLYQRVAVGTELPSPPSVETTYTFSTHTLSGANNGWLTYIPPGTDPVVITQAPAIASADVATIEPADWSASAVISSVSPLNIALAPAAVQIAANADGSVKAGQLPALFVVNAQIAGASVPIQVAIVSQSGCSASVYTDATSGTVYGVKIDSISALTGQVNFTVTAGGQTITTAVTFGVIQDTPPPSSVKKTFSFAGTLPGFDTTGLQGNSYPSSGSTPNDAVIVSLAPSAYGKLILSAYIEWHAPAPTSSSPGVHQYHSTIKLQYRTYVSQTGQTVWADVPNSEVTCSVARYDGSTNPPTDTKGTGTISTALTGLNANQAYDIRIVGHGNGTDGSPGSFSGFLFAQVGANS